MLFSQTIGTFACSGFSRPKFAKLRKSVTEKRDPKKHLLLSVAIRDRKHANRILRPKLVV